MLGRLRAADGDPEPGRQGQDAGGAGEAEDQDGAALIPEVTDGDAGHRRGQVVGDIEAEGELGGPVLAAAGASSSLVRRMSRVAATLPNSKADTPTSSRPRRPPSTGRMRSRSGWRSRSSARGAWRIA
jgi:hypothetical protein